MKWFQHQSDASDDIKIKRLEYKLGISAYGVYFKTLEKVAKEGQNHILDLKKFPLGFLASEFRVPENELTAMLTEMNDLGLIELKTNGIHVPNMEKYVGNWERKKNRGTTEELRRGYEVTPPRREEKRREETRLEKIRKEKNISSSLIPYYDGMKVVAQNGNLFCIPGNGGQWLKVGQGVKDGDFKWLPK